jgi:hypothetical protein
MSLNNREDITFAEEQLIVYIVSLRFPGYCVRLPPGWNSLIHPPIIWTHNFIDV